MSCPALALFAGCSDDASSSSSSSTGGTADGGADAAPLAPFSLEVPCADTADSLYGDPGALPAEKGAIIRCVKDKEISAADLESQARANNGYDGPAFTSGATVYRVLYRTERGDAKATAGYSVAQVYVPTKPRADKLPLVVASRGSRGQAAKCAPSKNDPAGDYVKPDYEHQVYPLAGAGYVVIASDLAGYANYGAANNPPSAYADVLDVGKSTLDAARALRNMFKSSMLDKAVFVGHSQGGGTALGALAIAESYGFDIPIAGVGVYSPLWLTARTNAGVLNQSKSPEGRKFSDSAVPVVSLWYLYTKAELREGPGKGLEIFQADKRAAIKDFVDNTCWSQSYPALEKLGPNLGAVLDPEFMKSVGVLGSCAAGDALCDKWFTYFDADRPPLTGKAGTVPIQNFYGLKDTTIPPSFAACVLKKMKKDGAKHTMCIDDAADHGTIVSKKAAYMNDWIASLTLGTPAPATGCEKDQSKLVDDKGAPVECDTILDLVSVDDD
jgi:pimeloyl-ACP methyl ester carboxylesterase